MDTTEAEVPTKSFPYVYLGPSDPSNLEGFNAVSINLDARLDSSLKWEKQLERAINYHKEGYNILWELHFGLFKELHLPLSDTSQYRSLNIAIDHFFDYILKDLSEVTIGVSIYKGPIDFSHNWSWEMDQVLNFRGWLSERFKDHHAFINEIGIQCSSLLSIDPKELSKNENGKNLVRFYCMQAAVDYFTLLTTRFEADSLPFVLLDTSMIDSPTHAFQLLDFEDFEFIQAALKGAPFESSKAIAWESKPFINGYIGKEYKAYQKPKIEPKIGIVIPSRALFDVKEIHFYDEIIKKIESRESIKLISEKNITIDWQGLEVLIAIDIESDSKRKLEGFIAAGGQVYTKNNLGLSQELPLTNYLNSQEG
ncbi:MAG: hypothetical protein S4CHLAM6_01070 [Chlamydiae bacterium]|nr:hypothetical protein [Chlamydiota bacterium]